MDRFMDNADPVKKARSKAIQTELNACRERARLLVEGKVSLTMASLRRHLISCIGDTIRFSPGAYTKLLDSNIHARSR